MRLLLVTYEFPPKGGPGIQRPLQTARLLTAAGWDVTVLTVEDPPTSLLDPAANAAIPLSVTVARAWSLEPTRLLQALRGSRRSAQQVSSAAYSGAPSGLIRFVQSFFLPDEKVGWTSYAVREGLRRHQELPFDVILASGPPFTAYRVAEKLSVKLGVPWVADVRDPIVSNYFFRPATALHARYLRAFERRVVARAARVVVVTAQIRGDMAARNPGAESRLVTITNGFDPASFEDTKDVRDDCYFNVSYVGSFQGDIRPEPFLDAVKLALNRDPSLHHDLRVRLVGSSGSDLSQTIQERALAENVTATGFVSHEQAIREMRAADVLLLVLADVPHLRPTLTGKLPEYLGARKPIFALVPPGAAHDVLDRTGAAEIVAPSDVEGAATALIKLHRAWRDKSLPVPDPVVVTEFDRTKLVARLSVMLEQVANESRP